MKRIMSSTFAFAIVTSILSATGTAQGAVQKAALAVETKIGLESTRAALGLPLANRLQALQEQGPAGYRNLVAIMFDASMSTDLRWKAVTAVGRIGGELSKPELEKALQSQEWFMRNAGLIAMEQADRGQAISWARRLLSDKALVVRAAAVDTIAHTQDAASATILWGKLQAAENFKGKQSLFIRRKIVETLAQIETKGREAKFIEVLADADETLHAPAIAALERLTETRLGSAKEPMKFKRAQWMRWWQDQDRARL